MQLDNAKIPDPYGATSTIDGANKQQLTEADRLLAEVYELLEEYAPPWYSQDLRDRLKTELKWPEQSGAPRA